MYRMKGYFSVKEGYSFCLSMWVPGRTVCSKCHVATLRFRKFLEFFHGKDKGI